jgi:predicted acyltransferase
MATDLKSAAGGREGPAPVVELPRKASATPSPGEGRLVSLDTFRGFIMFWIVGGEALAAGLQALKPNFVFNSLVYELNHTPWVGLRFYDCIWPSFMLMVGLSVFAAIRNGPCLLS